MNKRKDSAKVADAYEKLYSELPEKLSGVEAAEQSEKPREALEAMPFRSWGRKPSGSAQMRDRTA